MSDVTGKVYLLTGGGGAIAASIADVFARAGARLALVDRQLEHVQERARALGGAAFAADLNKFEQVQTLVSQVRQQMGRLDGLIHTVGGFSGSKVAESDPALYDRLFDLNVRTLFYCTRAVLPVLLEQNEGFIAGISAGAAWRGAGPGMALYTAAKSAVAAFLRSLDAELKGTNIRVAVVYPMGTVDTPANRRDMPDADPTTWIDPAEIGQTLLYAASRSARGRVLELPVYPPR